MLGGAHRVARRHRIETKAELGGVKLFTAHGARAYDQRDAEQYQEDASPEFHDLTRPSARFSLDAAGFVVLLLLAAAAPFPYGAVLPGGTLRLELLSFLALALALFAHRTTPLRPARIPILAALGIITVGALQLIPLPDDLLRTVAPLSARAWSEAAESIRLFDPSRVMHGRISVAPNETIGAILLTSSYVAAFVAAALLLHTRQRRRLFAWTLFASGMIQIIIGVAEPELADDRVSGSFVNPNHLAGYLEIVLAVMFGVIWAEILTGRDRLYGAEQRSDQFERRLLPLLPRILAWAAIAGGIAVTRSRGGILAAILMTFALLAMAALHRGRRVRRGRVAAMAAVAIVAGIVFVGVTTRDVPLTRFLATDPRDVGTDSRVRIWEASIEAWKQSPILGSGLGAFRDSFRRVQPQDVKGLIDYAHNEPLQLLVSGGAIGLALGILAYGGLMVVLFRLSLAQKHREESAMLLAAFGAMLALAFHGVTEFNLSIPAIAATLAMVAGMGIAGARRIEN